MKLFITGATGFIGKHLVSKLISEEHQVTINLYGEELSPFDENVKTHKLNEENIQVDIEYLKQKKFDGIIHLASLYLTIHKPDDAIKLINSNLRFSTYILECSAQAKIKWFINTGTFWQHYQNADYSPVNLYAATKQAFESIAQYYWETNQIKFCTLKLSDTFGPNDTRPKIFNLWEKNALSNEYLEMSAGDQIIDISYVVDLVLAFEMLTDILQNDKNSNLNGKIFAVKATKRYSLKELSLIFEKVIGKKLNIKWGTKPYREREVMIPWENGVCVPNWEPKVSLEEGIRRTFLIKSILSPTKL